MTEKKEKYPSSFTIDNFSSTATLARNEIKLPLGSSDTLSEKPYDPYEHRLLEHPNSFFGALVHLLKSSLGTGILAIPRAFKNAGLLVGLIGTVLIGLLCTHTIHILVVASQEMCKKAKVPSLGFAETAGEVCKHGPKKMHRWAGFARNFVEIALVTTYYVGNAVYVVFISSSIQKLVGHHFPETNEWFDQYLMLLILIPLILCCQVRELKHLVPFSLIANTTMIIAFAITLYYLFYGIDELNVNERKLAADITGYPLFYSTVIFAMEGIGTIMPVENSMQKPKFIGCPGVLNSAMSIVVVLYATMGFFGYMKYGENVEGSITLNLDIKEIPAQVVQACIATAVFFTFMLQFYVPVDITWRRIKHLMPAERHNICQIILRTGLVIFVVGIAMAAGDNLGPLIDLVGSVFFSTLGLMIPAVLDIILRYEKGYGAYKWRCWKDVIIIILAVLGLVSGCYYAILEFVK